MTVVRCDVVTIRMNELHSQRRLVPAWETPVIEAVHSNSDVRVEGHQDHDMELPDAGTEYERLLRRYGANREQGDAAYVVQVYGLHGAGLSRLADAIQAAIVAKPSRKDSAA